ncbi:hypothetical protein ACLB2K_011590 [Fragaria x ananassa]
MPIQPTSHASEPPGRRFMSAFPAAQETQNPISKKRKMKGGLQILKRWDVPWEWQTVSLTSLACGLSFVLTGLVEAAAGPYLGFSIQDLSLDEKAEFLLVAQGGKILHIDFGDCFEASMNREKFPEKFLFIKFSVCQPAVPPQEQPNDDDHDDGGIDSIDTS